MNYFTEINQNTLGLNSPSFYKEVPSFRFAPLQDDYFQVDLQITFI